MASNTGELFSLMTGWTVNVHTLLFCCYINTLIMFIVKQTSVTDVTVASLHNELFGRQTNNFILCYFIALQSLKENEVYRGGKVKSNQRQCRSLQCAKKTEKIRDHNASRTPRNLLETLSQLSAQSFVMSGDTSRYY